MRTPRSWTILVVVVALVAAACGGGSSGGDSSGQERKVQIDYKHDEFAGSFLNFFPNRVEVHPGDTVRFKQYWSGEPHSVTMGKLVDELGKPYWDIIDPLQAGKKVDVPEGDPPGGDKFFQELPFMLNFRSSEPLKAIQAAAQPCYLDSGPVPFQDPDKPCPKRKQPAFNGRQSYYNSGFIPFQGAKGNSFTVPVAADTAPGTYHFYCNYHFLVMGGSMVVVPKDKPTMSQAALDRRAAQQVRERTTKLDKLLERVKAGKNPDQPLPTAGAGPAEESEQTDPLFNAYADEFVPSTVKAKVGQKVTWSFNAHHTVSFNVPKYFPLAEVRKDGTVFLDPRGFEVVGWPKPPPPADPPGRSEGPPPPTKLDVGTWDGTGGLHSSGGLGAGDTFTVAFSRPGTYLMACLLHPAMVGKVVVG